MRKNYSGSSTIEMAYLMPLCFLMLQCIILALFYYHDKNILAGAAYETAVTGTQLVKMKEQDEQAVERLLAERITGKLILFGSAQKEVTCTENKVTVSVTVRKGKMQLHASVSVPVTEPEKEVRRIRSIKNAVSREEE